MPDLASYRKMLKKESPRGAAIISTIILDDLLRALLATFMIENTKQVDKLLGSDKNWDRPLGTFNARTRAAYCLGLLSEDEFHDLKLLRKIRNDFAHALNKASFDDKQIRDRCKSLRIPKHKKNASSTALELLILSTGRVAISIESRTRRAARERRMSPTESEAF